MTIAPIVLIHHEQIVCSECLRVIASCKCWEHTCERETHAVKCYRCAKKRNA